MENKINITELLKDCPSGMELNCLMYEDVYFDYVDELNNIHCYIQQEFNKTSVIFNQDGTPTSHTKSKCVIFPKYKTTWEGFVPPCEFKDGDVCYVKTRGLSEFIFIFKVSEDNIYIRNYVSLSVYELYTGNCPLCATDDIRKIRLATEEEKQKLFCAIKGNGYKWNTNTKTLEKLVEPKFKVGNVIQDKGGYKVRITDVSIEDGCYGYESLTVNGIGGISFNRQDNWELVPNKFDITTLVPFESRVLVRDHELHKWHPAMWGYYDCDSQDYPYKLVGSTTRYRISYEGKDAARYCIPYEGNEHLLGTTNDCDEYYKTWE